MSLYKELSYDTEISPIKGIQFCILSADAIIARSVAEITKSDTFSNNEPVPHGLFDPRMGVIEHNKVCVTCEKRNNFCPGHFGHIVLAKPVFYAQFFPIVKNLLKCICFRCSKLLVDPDSPEIQNLMAKKYSRQKRYETIFKLSSKIKRCGKIDGCGSLQPSIAKEGLCKISMEWKTMGEEVKKQILNAEDVKRIFERISDRDSEILGFHKKYNRPEDLICTVMPVPPPAVRPSIRNDTGQRSEDDLSHKLSSLVKINNGLRIKVEKGAKEQIENMSALLQYEVATLIDNTLPGIPPAQQRTGRPIRSLIERLKGKEGRIRGNLMGKRVDFSARSVITPDPNISIDELGVPIKIAMNLTTPMVVNEYNMEELVKYVENGPDRYPGAKYVKKTVENRTIRLRNVDRITVAKELEYGDIVERHLKDGDYVLFNRQPSLHRSSMMAHRVVVMAFNTFRLNVMVTPSFNADFDGDEMNMHVAQSLQSHEELLQLAAVPTQIISPRECKPIISIVQDIVLGLYRMTKGHVELTAKQFSKILAPNPMCDGFVPPPGSKNKMWTGHQLLSTIMPRKITMNMGNGQFDEDKKNYEHFVKINCGQVLSGIFDKGIYQARTAGIIHSIYNEYGPEETRIFFDNTQQMICNFLVLDGFSVGISDLVVDNKTLVKFKDIIKTMKDGVDDIIKQVLESKYEVKSTKSKYEDFEKKINDKLNSAISEVGKEGLKTIDENTNRLINMVKSGSKGNPLNVSQMIGCLGQQNVDGRRIPYGFDDRTLPHFSKYDDGPAARGFVENSFIKGLNPQEFFFAAMGGREGLIDTAVNTSETGYLQRKLVKAMEDCKVCYDMSVRNAAGSIIQFLYGDDGMDASKIESQKVPYIEKQPGEIIEEYVFGDNFEELEGIMTEDAWASLTAPAALKKCRLAMADHFKNILADRDFIITQMFDYKVESTVMYPVSIMRTITIAKGLYSGSTRSDLDPLMILEELEKLSTELYVNKHHKGTQLFHILLRAHLSPKVVLIKHGLSRAAFEYVVSQIRIKFYDSLAHPSEMVGVIAAQSLGEPATQLSTRSCSRIQISTKGGVTYDGPIGEFIDKMLAKNRTQVINIGKGSVVYDPTEDIYIIGVSNEEKTTWRRVQQISRHPANGGMVRIQTMSGKTTCATLSHSFLKRTERGIDPVLGSDLKIGDRVPVAKFIPQVQDAFIIKTVKIGGIERSLDRDFGWLCGAYIADGSISGNVVSISKVIREYQGTLERIYHEKFNIDSKLYEREAGESNSNILHGWEMNKYSAASTDVSSRMLADFFMESFNTGSHIKRLPPWVYSAPTDFVSGLLCGYFDGDGNVNSDIGKQMMRTASVSELLTDDFILLFARVGIFASKCRERHIKEQGRNDLHTVQISRKYAKIFKERVGPLVVKSKAICLDEVIEYIEREDKHNLQEMIDKIPELGEVIASIGKTLALEGQSRLYGRWTKKEAIGRETLESYLPVFEDGLVAKVKRDTDAYNNRKETHANIQAIYDTFMVSPAAFMKKLAPDGSQVINARAIMSLPEDLVLAKALVDMGSELTGCGGKGGLICNSNSTKYRKTGKMQASTLKGYLDALGPLIEERHALDLAAAADVRDDKLPVIRQALDADVVWDEITEIEYLPDPGEMVYDLTVPGNDSFMVDCGILVHNTLNSVHHDTEFLLRIDGQLTRTTIGDFAEGKIDGLEERHLKRLERHPNDTTLVWLKDGGDTGPISSGVEVLSADENGKVIWDEISAVTKHPVINEDGSNTLLKVTTRSGREVIATKGDSFVMRIDNKLQKVKGSDLKVGDALPVSNILPVFENGIGSQDKTFKEINFLDVSMYLPKNEFTYGTDILKAVELSKTKHQWWKEWNGKEFIVPYSRSDTMLVSARRTEYEAGIVYPWKCTRTTSKVPDMIPLTNAFGFMVGAYLAEGCVSQCNDSSKDKDQFHQLLISNIDKDYQAKVDAFSKNMNVQYHWDVQDDERGLSMTQRLHSIVLATLFKRMLGYLAQNKRFPAHLLAANDEFLHGVIDGYFSGDGSINVNGTNVTASSVSKGLLEDMSLILQRFDIRSAITMLKKKEERFQQGYSLSMYCNNARNFMRKFKLTLKDKQDKMDYGNKRIIINSLTYDTHDDILIKLSDGISKKVHRDHIVPLIESTDNTADKIILQNALDEEVFYDRIKSIEEIQNTKSHVYDFTTRITRNFGTYNGSIFRDTFHMSGVGAASKSVRGVPRLKEILSVSKFPKTSSMHIHFKDEFKYDRVKCEQLMNDIRIVRFKDIVTSTHIFFDPNDSYQADQGFTCLDAPSSKPHPWVLRMEFDKEMIFQYNLEMGLIHQKLLEFYRDAITCKFSDDNAKDLIFRIRLTNMDTNDDVLTELKALEHGIMEKLVLKGTEGIERVSIDNVKHRIYDPLTQTFNDKDEWVVYTDGTNFREILANEFVAAEKVYSNDIIEVYETLGIEAARQTLYNEIQSVLETVTVNYRHVALLIDYQTNKGYLLSIDRHGINRGDIGPLAKCSFEESTDKLIKAGIFAEYDNIKGVSANIMVGQIVPAGTGDVSIMIDEGKLPLNKIDEEEEDTRATAGNNCDFDFDFELPGASLVPGWNVDDN